ncbi:hypothetical protein E4523_19805 [Escherichia coli]|nr:hypothetical protein [Escherichia coli]
MPAASIRPGNLRQNRRPDKAFTPHLASGANAGCDACELNPKTWTVSVNRLFDTQSGILPG